MSPAHPRDPYVILGLTPAASEPELRTAYRRLVQLHHPDHNHGSHESALRFAEVQEAYAHVKLLRKQAGVPPSAAGATTSDPALEARLAEMERELAGAREQREKAARTAVREAARAVAKEPGRASDADLGYVSSEDSFSKIFDDAVEQAAAHLAQARDPDRPVRAPRPRSITSWIDELGARLTGDREEPETPKREE